LAMHKHALRGNHEKFQRWPMRRGFSSYFAAIQPVPAYIGLISCLIIVFIFNSAVMWNGNQVLIKGLNIYLGVSKFQSVD
jgi:amino acid transporter